MKSYLRKVFLVLLIVFDLLMLLFWWLGEQYTFFWVFVGINVCVLLGEVINSLWIYGKTLSTQVTKTLEQKRDKRLIIYLALTFLGLSIASLIAHLAIW